MKKKAILRLSDPSPDLIRTVGEVKFVGAVRQEAVHGLSCGIGKFSGKKRTMEVQQFI